MAALKVIKLTNKSIWGFIAGSGMCTGGRIVDHLQYGLDDPRNDIFFVGYQTKGTPGRKMIEKKIPVKAGIHTLTAYSAHADQRMLVDWVRAMPEPPKEIRLVQGEADARQALAMALGITGKEIPSKVECEGNMECIRLIKRNLTSWKPTSDFFPL